MWGGHHRASSLLLEIEIELHAIPKRIHGVHVEELLKVIVDVGVHGVMTLLLVDLLVVVVVPCCRVHHGRARCGAVPSGAD